MKTTTEIAINTTEQFHIPRQPLSHASDQSNLNTPSNVVTDANTKLRLFRKYNSSNSKSNSVKNRGNNTSHSIELERQSMLQQKYYENLSNYPPNRLTPQAYESIERPNSVTGSIKLRKSHDFNTVTNKNYLLDMYTNKPGKHKQKDSRYAHQRSAE